MMTEQDALRMYADMVQTIGEEGPEKVESMILRLGRTDMSVLCSFLFVRALTLDMEKFKVQGGPDETA